VVELRVKQNQRKFLSDWKKHQDWIRKLYWW